MTVIVKGMKMPKCCGDCPFCKDGGEGDVICSLTNEDTLETDCCLVEIPEKHGRLIDAYDALKSIRESADFSLEMAFGRRYISDIETETTRIEAYCYAARFINNCDSYLGTNE